MYDFEEKEEREAKESLWRTPEREEIMEIMFSNSHSIKTIDLKLKRVEKLGYSVNSFSRLKVKQKRDLLAEVRKEIKIDSKKYNPGKYYKIIRLNSYKRTSFGNGYLRR